MANLNGETQLIGFFGSTYKTSKMYAMYNAAFEALGLNYIYVPLVVKDLAKATAGVRHLGIKAVGVTIPYKIAIIPYLDELDSNASRIGAVNAIVNHDGLLLGANTDGKGAVKALQEVIALAGKKVVLLGAGGAARAIAFAIVDEGGELVIVNRTRATAEDLAKAVDCKYETMDKLEQELEDAHVVINATSAGMVPHVNESLVRKEVLSPESVVMDLVSTPKETKLLKEARERGCNVVYGDRMLFWQGVLKFEIYTGVKPPVEVMEKAINHLS
jgi:shikimate dehydrogenase